MPIPPTEYEPSIAGVVGRSIERRLLAVHTCIPARVERWDASKGLVDAQPLVMAYKRGRSGGREAYVLGVAVDVPVLFTGGGGGPGEGFRQTYPVQPGDIALLLCSEASLDKWLERGDVVDPEDDRRHHLSDGIAIVGLRPAVSPWTGISADATTWGKDGGLQVHVTESDILLGGSAATDDVATAQKVGAQLDALASVFDAWVPVPGDGGAALKALLTTLLVTWPGATGSSAVKVKP